MSGTTHTLKTWPEMFDAIEDGRKRFDVRRNDRGFQTGDTLIFRKYSPEIDRHYQGVDPIVARVTYILSGFGIESGYVAMSFEIDRAKPDNRGMAGRSDSRSRA